MYKNFVKPIADFLAAVVLLAITSPVLIVIIIMLAVANRGKVFFLQPRIGKNNRKFVVIKFKTMNDMRDEQGRLLPDEVRQTRLGRFIRKTSLDELPQLINVAKGEMSIVGPRPLLVQYLPLYNDFQRRRHEVLPGITGWAQINGRNAISWAERFAHDVWYVDNISFWLDIKIILITIFKVMKSEGISSKTSATMETFTGN